MFASHLAFLTWLERVAFSEALETVVIKVRADEMISQPQQDNGPIYYHADGGDSQNPSAISVSDIFAEVRFGWSLQFSFDRAEFWFFQRIFLR